MLGLFFQEVLDYIPGIEHNIDLVSQSETERQGANELHRLFHNIKGASSQLYLNSLSNTACSVELLLDDLIQQQGTFTPEILNFLRLATRKIVSYCQNGKRDDHAESKLFQEMHSLCSIIEGVSGGSQFANLSQFLTTKTPNESFSSTTDTTQKQMATQPNKQKTIRSIIKLLGQLNNFGLRQNLLDVAEETIVDIHTSITVLCDCLDEQDGGEQLRFLKAFDSLLTKVALSQLKGNAEVVGLLGDFLTYLEVLFASPSSLNKDSVNSIIEKMHRVESLLTHDKGTVVNDVATPEANLLAEDKVVDFPLPGRDDLFGEVNDDIFGGNEELDLVTELFNEPISGFTDGPDDVLLEKPTTEVETDYFEDEEYSLEDIFKSECEEHLETIANALNNLEKDGTSDHKIDDERREALKEMRRAIHTLKGAAAITGFSTFSEFAHHLEDLLDYLFEEAVILSGEAVILLATAIARLEELSQVPEAVSAVEPKELKVQIDSFLVGTEDQEDESDQPELVAEVGGDEFVETREDRQETVATAARVENVRVRLDKLEELVNLEGDLVIARNSMTNLLDDLNQTVGELETAKDKIKKIAGDLEAGFEVQALHGFGVGTGGSGVQTVAGDAGKQDEFDVLELDQYSELNLIIRSLNEMSIDVNAIYSHISQIAGEIKGQLSGQEITMRMMQDRFMRIRMTPISSISRMFYRAVRETSIKLNKKVRLLIKGEDVYLDRFVWSKVTDPVMHILRNCIDHGIEVDRGSKPETATISIETFQRGNMVVMRVSDDGAGVDTVKLKEKLIGEGRIGPAKDLPESELLVHLFTPGVSTRDGITHVSGRGVGLDVVQKNIQDLRGYVHIHTNRGEGTTFELNIPISLSVNRAVIAHVNEMPFAVPLYDITEILSTADIEEGINGLIWRGEKVQKRSLATLLGKSSEVDGSGESLAIMISSGETNFAITVDSITGQQEIVVKDLGSHLTDVHGVSGVTDFGDGLLVPILDLPDLVSERSRRVEDVEDGLGAVAQQSPIKVLVVDDSISVRQSVLRLLKKRKWVVEAAKDGVDALEKLELFSPDVIISDIEMPRMNGYEFKEVLNNRIELWDVPVVMLTSRISEKHKQKARELGVQRYVVKPYQDDRFISLIQEMAGVK